MLNFSIGPCMESKYFSKMSETRTMNSTALQTQSKRFGLWILLAEYIPAFRGLWIRRFLRSQIDTFSDMKLL
jgi:hypothetical protein